MKLSPAAFNAHLNHLGQDFTWRKAYACPCVNPHSGAAKPNCPHCDGKGRLWDAPAVGKAGIVGRDQLRKFAVIGLWDQGDIMLSIPSDSPLYAMGQFDRVTATNRSEQFSMNFVRGLNDRIRHVIIAIERVFWIGSGDVLVEGNIPAIGADGTLTWADGAPPPNTTYSITGRRRPEFFCFNEIPADRPLHFGEPLPRRVVLRRFDLFGR
jgi:hypothetical protein